MTKIILDTDFGNVYDDAGALAVLHSLQDRGEIELLATVTNMGHPFSAGALCSVNKYFGREEIPVGGVAKEEMDCRDTYAQAIVEQFPARIRTYEDAEPAVELLRCILAENEDLSVTYVAIGATNVMANLLRSRPDDISELDGEALVAKKIKRLVIMGGSFDPTVPRTDNPNGVADGWTYNWSGYSPADSKYVFDHWPGPVDILTSEAGYLIRTGKAIYGEEVPYNPVRIAYDIYNAKKEPHKTIDGAWDQLTMLLAARGYDSRWRIVEHGCCEVDDKGCSVWNTDRDKGHSYGIILPEYIREVSAECDALMVEGLLNRKQQMNS